MLAQGSAAQHPVARPASRASEAVLANSACCWRRPGRRQEKPARRPCRWQRRATKVDHTSFSPSLKCSNLQSKMILPNPSLESVLTRLGHTPSPRNVGERNRAGSIPFGLFPLGVSSQAATQLSSCFTEAGQEYALLCFFSLDVLAYWTKAAPPTLRAMECLRTRISSTLMVGPGRISDPRYAQRQAQESPRTLLTLVNHTHSHTTAFDRASSCPAALCKPVKQSSKSPLRA